jgi:hypothetical protein
VDLLRLENGGGDFGPGGFRLAGTGVKKVALVWLSYVSKHATKESMALNEASSQALHSPQCLSSCRLECKVALT